MVYRLMFSSNTIANGAVVGANGVAAWSWIAGANDVLQLILTIVGIVAAVAAAQYHFEKTKRLKKDDSG